MKSLLIFLFLLFATIAHGADERVQYDAWYSTDSDAATVFRNMVYYMPTEGVGFGYINTNYDVNSSSNASALAAVLDVEIIGAKVNGYAGVGQHNSGVYLLGDVGATYTLTKQVDIIGGVYADLVDSERGLDQATTYIGAYGGVDYHADPYGAVALVYQNDYSNNNTQLGVRTKVYYSFIPGWHAYVKTKDYTNSNPWNGHFYSPDVYERRSVGVGWRLRNSDWLYTGWVEAGTLNGGTAQRGRFAVEYKADTQWTYKAAYLRDMDSFGYTYNLLSFSAVYKF